MDDIAYWRDYFSATHPVLGDLEQVVWDLYGGGPQPQYMVIDRDMTIRHKDDRRNALTYVEPIVISYL